MVAVTNLLSKYTILYGKVTILMVTIQSVATVLCRSVVHWKEYIGSGSQVLN